MKENNIHFYHAYGLNISSTFPLPELTPTKKNNSDLVIRQGKINRPKHEVNSTGSYFQLGSHEAYLFWKIVGAFLVHNGKEVIVDPLPNVEEKLIRLPLLSAVLATVLYQRGHVALHANAIDLYGSAVAFLGHKCSGKSTMTAALYARGHRLVSDDVVVIDLINGTPKLIPGFPQLKLMPDSASAIGNDPNKLEKLASIIDKRNYPAHNNFSLSTVPLKHFYILSEGSCIDIKPLNPKNAFIEIFKHSFSAKVFKDSVNQYNVESFFDKCADLVEKVPVSLLKRPASLELVPQIASLIEKRTILIQKNKII